MDGESAERSDAGELPQLQAVPKREHDERDRQRDEQDVERRVRGERRPHPLPPQRSLTPEHAQVVVRRIAPGRREVERER